MTQIFYHPISFPSLSPVFAASAVGLDHEKTVVDLMTGQHKEPDYLALNPVGKVPTLKDGDFTLFESAAIMRYLARKAGSPLYPDDIQAQAKIDQWIDFINHHIRRHVATVQFNRNIAKFFGAETDEAAITEALGFLDKFLPIIDKQLGETGFMVGDSMTLADIALVAAMEPSNMARIDLSAHSNLTNWLETRRSEEFYTNVHSHFGEELGM